MRPPPNRHLLIVDDHAGAAEVLAEVLHLSIALPFTTDIGHDGAEGVRLATTTRPDVVLLDIDMPVMNGVDAAAAIRHLFPSPPPLLIAITGNSTWKCNLGAQRVLRPDSDQADRHRGAGRAGRGHPLT